MTTTAADKLAAAGGRKAEQLCLLLRQDIMRGRFEAGASLPTQTQLGRKYGVAATTAAIAMSRLAHEGLVRRIPGRGTFVNEDAAPRGRVIEFVRERSLTVPDRDSALRWVEELTEISRSRGWSAHWHHLTLAELADWSLMRQRFAEARALVAIHVFPIHLDRLYALGVPVVSVMRTPTSEDHRPQSYPQVAHDRRGAARMGMEHLVGLGYRRIAYLGTLRDPFRLAAYLEVTRDRRLMPRPEWIVIIDSDDDTSASQAELVRSRVGELMAGGDRPQAICCATYRQAMAAEQAILALGLNVPDDVALVCCNGAVGQPAAPVTLTSFGPSVTGTCALALQMVEAIAPGRPHDTTDMLDPVYAPSESLIGASCGARLRGHSASAGPVLNRVQEMEVTMANK